MYRPIIALATATLLSTTAIAAPDPGLENPSVGVNLDPPAYWATGLFFIDAMKLSAPWSAQGVPNHALDLDKRGWPRRLPVRDGKALPVRTLTLFEHGRYEGGRYVLTYKGEGRIRVHGDARAVKGESVPGRQVYEVTPSKAGLHVEISETDPRGNGAYIRNVSLMREELVPLYEAGARILPEYLEQMQDFRVVRFMNWMRTNNSKTRDYADRPFGSTASWAEGVPLYTMIDLANQAGADPWFTIPHLASDAYIRTFAWVVRTRLDPKLKAHFEYSNEVWNTGFEQGRWAREQGRAAFGPKARIPETQFYAKRASEMADILDRMYRGQEHRLVKVLGTQTVWPGRTETMLAAPDWKDKGGRSVAERFDALAVTTYFGDPGRGGDANLRRWASEGQAGRDAVIQELTDGSVLGDGSTAVPITTMTDRLAAQGAIARRHGLKLLAYEGGLHLTATGPAGAEKPVTELLRDVARDPRMGGLYDRMFQAFRQAGGETALVFTDVGSASRWGAWGLIEHLEDDTPRRRAVDRANAVAPRAKEARRPGTFANGAYVLDDGESDTLRGGPGRDLFAVSDAVTIEGGAGYDTARLPPRPGGYTVRREGRWTFATPAGQRGVRYRLLDVEKVIAPRS